MVPAQGERSRHWFDPLVSLHRARGRWRPALSCTLILLTVLLALVVPATAAADPHGSYGIGTRNCTLCHTPHEADSTKILRAVSPKALCYTCHDGSGSVYDTKRVFGESGEAPVSSHPVSSGLIGCSDCHTPHHGPADGNPRALAASSTAPAPSRESTSSAVCGACHGAGSGLAGGDLLSGFRATAHDASTTPPASGTSIACLACHSPHASSNRSLLATFVVDSAGTTHTVAVTSRVDPLCYGCHQGPSGRYPGQAVFAATPHSSAWFSTKAAIVWPGSGAQYGSCANCHEPHGKGGFADYTRAAAAAACTTCHDVSGAIYPAGYSYQGATKYTGSAHSAIGGSTGSCQQCHEVHGGRDASGTLYPALTVAPESSTCLGNGTASCHNSSASADGINIAAALTAGADSTSHHDLMPGQQAASGSRLKCSDCHDPHAETKVDRFSNPDSIGTTVTSGLSGCIDASGAIYVAIGAEHDGIAPVVTNLAIASTNAAAPRFTWSTDESATTWVDWGLTTGYELGSVGASLPLGTSHAATMTATIGSSYHYRIRSADALGNEFVSVDGVYFAAPPPTAPPSISPTTWSGSVYGYASVNVPVSWSAATPGDADPLQYQVVLDGVGQGWQSGLNKTLTVWTVGVMGVRNHPWYVQARDSVHTYSVSAASPGGTISVNDLTDYSCPILYTWDGNRFAYVTDVMGRGVLGIQVAPGEYRYPPSVEDSRIDASQLQPKNGRYELRLKNEKDEIEFVDEVKLRAVDHPKGTSVYLDDLTRTFDTRGLAEATIFTVRDPKPVRATYDNVALYKGTAVTGRDISSEIASADGVFAPASLFDDNRYTFDLGDLSGAANIKLVMRGWSEYASPAERSAWLASGSKPASMALEVADANGRWRVVDADLSFIPGYDKTVVFDLTGKFPPKLTDYKVRMRGLTRTWIDWVAVDTSAPEPVKVTTVEPVSAELGFKGVARKTSSDYPAWDYDETADAPVRTHEGAFTRFGDVRELLEGADDRFVIMDTGDEIALSFPEVPLADGMERTYVIHTDGYFQELTGKVEPLPFHGMSTYPYGAGERYPQDAEHSDYLREYNTRVHQGGTGTAVVAGDRSGGWYRSLVASVRAVVARRLPRPAAPVAQFTQRTKHAQVLPGTTRVVAAPGPHYSVNSDLIVAKSLGLGRAALTYGAAAAWESSGTSTPPLPGTGSLVGAGRLASLTASDGTYLSTGLCGADRGWNWQVVKIGLTQAERARVSELRLLWQGYGEPTIGYTTKLMVFNAATGTWGSTVTRTSQGSPVSLTVAKSAVPSTTCLACHDGSPPAGVVVPVGVTNVGATWAGAYHGSVATGTGTGLGGLIGQYTRGQAPAVPCVTCHDPHGNANLYHFPTVVADTTVGAVPTGASAVALCSACHTRGPNEWHYTCTNCHYPGYYEGHPSYYNHGPSSWTGTDCLGCHGHGRVFDHTQTSYYIENESSCHCGVPAPYKTF